MAGKGGLHYAILEHLDEEKDVLDRVIVPPLRYRASTRLSTDC
jgi:hypothetical protein